VLEIRTDSSRLVSLWFKTMKRKHDSTLSLKEIDHVVENFVPNVLDNPISFIPKNPKVKEDVMATMKLLYDYGMINNSSSRS